MCERSKRGLCSREGCDGERRWKLGKKETRVLIYMMLRKAETERESFPISVLNTVTRCDSNGKTIARSKMVS